jgi:hypothetical protein
LSNFRKTCHTIEKERCLMQNVGTVGMIVKYHSNQKKTDLYIAKIASKNTNQSHVVVPDLAEDQIMVTEVTEVTEVPDLVDATTDQERCLMQNVGTVEMIVKYHSNQKKTDLYIAENASKIIDNRNLF